MGNASVMKLITFFLAHVPWAYSAFCDSPSPGYPIPDLTHRDHAAELSGVLRRITSTIEDLISDPTYSTTHYSLEITTQTTTLLSTHHTADERSTVRRGAEVISNSTNYRIASMTKPFTVLALLQQHKAGNLSLDDSVAKYLPELDTTGQGKGAGGLPWKDITIRALASQLSGIPRDFAQGDLINSPDLAARLGLPPAEGLEMPKLPRCDEMVNYSRACGPSDLLKWVDQISPVYAPNQKSTYSNINYDLLGLVIAKGSGLAYEDYIQTRILDVVGMTGSSFSTPSDDVAAITKGIEYYWPLEIGVQNPTGGLYSNTADLSRWLRYVLSSYNGQDSAVNWFNPASWSGSLDSFYGMPWEIFRAKVKDVVNSPNGSTMPLTFVTKGGGLPGYTSEVIMVPELGLGFSILVSGNKTALGAIQEVAVREMLSFAERVAMEQLAERYAGTYEDEGTNSTLELGVSEELGLFVEQWLSNGTDTKRVAEGVFAEAGVEVVLVVVPTLLFVDEEKQAGERWRAMAQRRRAGDDNRHRIWDNFCITDTEALPYYAGKPTNELVFWSEDSSGKVKKVEMTGFRKILPKTRGKAQRPLTAMILQQQS